jgi:VCBS repeat-containing protein
MKKSVLLTVFLLLSTIIFAQTNVFGAISSNTTWSLANSPYTITDNVLVANDVTLTIEAGVTVKVNSGLYIKNEGIITAVGTSSDKITFESSAGSPVKSDWVGIKIRSTGGSAIDGGQNYSSGSQFKYVVIKHADIGLYIYDAGLHISYTEFDTNKYGVEIRKTDGVVIDFSTFTGNTAGVWSEYETFSPDDTTSNILNTFIKNSTFSGNSYGIDLIINQRYFDNLNINNNIIKENTVGIDFSGGGYGCRVKSVNIFKNIIVNNSGYGLQVGQIYGYESMGSEPEDTYPLTVQKNIIVNNPVYWNYGGGVSGVTVKIANNIIYNPSETLDSYSQGLYFTGGTSKSDVITKNLIVSNGASLNLEDSYTDPSNKTFSYNTFIGQPLDSKSTISIYGTGHLFLNNNFTKVNNNYILKNTFSSSIDAKNNYWGTSTESEIKAAIYDYTDDFELGEVDYTPFSTALNTDAPISPPSNVTKSVSGSDVVLNWSSNGESDIAGYKLYYGTPTGYSYVTVVDLGNVTTYTVTGGDIATEYALTAYDSSLDGTDDMVDGNESWFSVSKEVKVTLTSSANSISEPTNSATLTATLDNTSSADVVVNLTYTGTATNATDYSGATSITIFVGSLTGTTAITAIDDTDVELTETIIIDMGDVSGAAENGTQQVAISLTDNDLPSVSSIIVDKIAIDENGGVAVITANISDIQSKDVTIPLTITGTATADTDYSSAFSSKGYSTVAGGNGSGSALNQIETATGIFVDDDGNLYVSESANNRVVKWAPGATEGTIVAGGNGTGSALNQLEGTDKIHVDQSKNIYIVDRGNARVMKWALGASEGVLVAGGNGTGSALNQFNYPTGIHVDSDSNIYISDNGNNRVMKWVSGGSEGTVVAGGNDGGSAKNQLSWNQGIDLDSQGNIYVADCYNHRVMKWAPGASEGVLVAGGDQSGYDNQGSALNELDYPFDVNLDNSGNIFIADKENHRIMKWALGATEGVAVAGGNGSGSDANRIAQVVSVFVDSKSNIYAGDGSNNRVQIKRNYPQVTIPSGSNTGTLTITAIQDTLYEDDETFIVTPSTSPTNATSSISDALTVTIVDENFTPVATVQTDVAATEQTEVTITLAGTDSNDDTLTYIIATLPSNGTLSDNDTLITVDDLPKTTTSADVDYISTSDTATSDSFTFKVNDGTVDSEAAAVSLAITAVNDVPTLSDDSVSTDEDNSIDITLNASDPDSSQITYAIASDVSNGTVNITNNIATYTPSENFNGSDSFKVTANDGEANSANAIISIIVTSVNDNPVANNNSILVDEGSITTVLANSETTLLHNDTDSENESLIAILVSEPSYGDLLLNTDGTFSYDHDGSDIASDYFTYKVNDGELDSNTATVSIIINTVNDNFPTDIILSNNFIDENLSGVTIGQFTAKDLDLPADIHAFELVSGIGDTNNTSFTITDNNLIINESFDYETQQSLSIRVKVIDEVNQSFERSYDILINNVNDISITSATTDSYCTGASGTGSITISSIDDTFGNFTLEWSAINGGSIPSGQETIQSLTEISDGTYSVTISDTSFSFTESFEIGLTPQYDALSICYVSSDETDETKNRIFLNNAGNYNVGIYEILRETNSANIYTSIGSILSTENSFLDENSNNMSRSYNYKVRLIDYCGNQSSNSDFHKTILLQSSVAVNNSVNLNWSDYEGTDFSTYNIFRNTNSEGFNLIGSVSASNNSFNDEGADITIDNYEYYISISVDECLNDVSGKSNSKSTTEIKSNRLLLSNETASVDDFNNLNQLVVFPNPSNDMTHLVKWFLKLKN